MGLFDDVRKALMDLVTVLPKLNRQNREEIRAVVLQLQSELERSVTLAILYLDGVSRIKPEVELIDYLQNAPSKLLDSYNEFKICAGLYGLADRSKQWFSTLPITVDVTQISSVNTLIADLANGERSVIDGLRTTTDMLAQAGRDLSTLSGQESLERKEALYTRCEMERNELQNQIDLVRRTTKDLLKRM